MRPGGRILAAFISRFSPFRHAAAYDPDWVLCRTECALSILAAGGHDRGSGFPKAYFAHPSEVAPFMERYGVTTAALIGCEGDVSMNVGSCREVSPKPWERPPHRPNHWDDQLTDVEWGTLHPDLTPTTSSCSARQLQRSGSPAVQGRSGR